MSFIREGIGDEGRIGSQKYGIGAFGKRLTDPRISIPTPYSPLPTASCRRRQRDATGR